MVRTRITLKDAQMVQAYDRLRGPSFSYSQFRSILHTGTLSRLRVDDLKQVISYLNALGLGQRIPKSGNKSILVERLRSALHLSSSMTPQGRHPRQPLSTSHHPQMMHSQHPHPHHQQRRVHPHHPSSSSVLVRLTPSSSSSMYSSHLRRPRTQLEQRTFDLICSDRTIRGHHDSAFYPITYVLDVVGFVRSIEARFPIRLTDDAFDGIVGRGGGIGGGGLGSPSSSGVTHELHMYCVTSDLSPVNWTSGIRVAVGGSQLQAPPPNRKLAAQKKKKPKSPETAPLITNAPLRIPRHIVKRNGFDGRPLDFEIVLPRWENTNYLMIVCVVRVLTTAEAVTRVKRRLSSPNWHKSRVREKRDRSHGRGGRSREDAEMEEDGILCGEEVLVLDDPILLTRIQIPARGVDCVHEQVFDLTSYLEFCHRSMCWNCPHCEKRVHCEDLYVDMFVSQIISSVGPDVDRVKLNIDNSFTAIDPETQRLITEPPLRSIDIDSSGDEDSPERRAFGGSGQMGGLASDVNVSLLNSRPESPSTPGFNPSAQMLDLLEGYYPYEGTQAQAPRPATWNRGGGGTGQTQTRPGLSIDAPICIDD